MQLCCSTTWPASANPGPHRNTGTTHMVLDHIGQELSQARWTGAAAVEHSCTSSWLTTLKCSSVRCIGTVRRLCTSADYSQVGSPLLQLLEASLEIPRETPEDAASGGQRVPQSHNPAYLGSLRLDTHQAGMCLWSSVWKRPSRRHIILAQTRSQVPLYCINT